MCCTFFFSCLENTMKLTVVLFITIWCLVYEIWRFQCITFRYEFSCQKNIMKLRAILLIVTLYIIYGYVEACQGFKSMDQMPMTKSKIHKKRRTFGMNCKYFSQPKIQFFIMSKFSIWTSFCLSLFLVWLKMFVRQIMFGLRWFLHLC